MSVEIRFCNSNDTPSFLGLAFHNRWQYGKANGSLTAQKSCLHPIKIGELWSNKSGVYGDGLATINIPNGRNRSNVFDSWDSYSAMDDRNRWTDLRQIHTEDVFGPSFGRVGMSRSKVKGQGHQVLKTRCAHTTSLQYGRNATASLQIMSRKQQARRFDCWRGVSSPACVVRAACVGSGGLPLRSDTHF